MLEELSRNSVIGHLPKWLLLYCSPDPRRGLFIGASFQKPYTRENTFERRMVLRSKDFECSHCFLSSNCFLVAPWQLQEYPVELLYVLMNI